MLCPSVFPYICSCCSFRLAISTPSLSCLAFPNLNYYKATTSSKVFLQVLLGNSSLYYSLTLCITFTKHTISPLINIRKINKDINMCLHSLCPILDHESSENTYYKLFTFVTHLLAQYQQQMLKKCSVK